MACADTVLARFVVASHTWRVAHCCSTNRELNSIHDNRHLAFLNVGFHGVNPDMSDSADIEIVNDLPGGQFDLSFCSLACLRSWFIGLVDQLEDDLAGQQAGSE